MKNYHDLIGWLRFMGKMQTSVSIYNQSADAIENLLKELHETKSELDKYRKAEKEGRLVVLPCKVGDDVWFVRKFGKERCIKKAEVSCINIDFRGDVFVSARRISGGYIGKTVFLTREEAEAALAQKGETDGSVRSDCKPFDICG